MLGVIYYLPDYTNLVNEFYWQLEDVIPEIPRVHNFLNYWKNNIEAVIKEVKIDMYDGNGISKYRYTEFYGELN